MAPSIVQILQEAARQTTTGDDRYFRQGAWIFTIRTNSFAGPAGPNGVAVFPLPVSPQRINLRLPFAKELTPAQEGGVVAEEGGIVIGDLTIGGTTGFKLRKQRSLTLAPGGGVFTGVLGERGGLLQEVSGQLAFWILANRCFEGYSELKKDPHHNQQTSMELHVLKDELHYEISPREFVLSRDSSKERVTYRYDIAADIIGPADALDFGMSEEKTAFEEAFDAIAEIRAAVQSISATIDDVTASIGELGRFVTGIASIVDDVKGIVDSASDLVAGTKDFFDRPKSFVVSVAETVESAADLFEETASLPADVAQSMRSIADGLDQITMAARNHFTRARDNIISRYVDRTVPFGGMRRLSKDALDRLTAEQETAASEGAAAGGTMSIDDAFGSVRPGDTTRRKNATTTNRFLAGDYVGLEDRVVGKGDTLQSLAAKHLRDASKWPDLMIVNRLQPPYITNGAQMPNTLQPGDTISIPVKRPTTPTRVFNTGGEIGVGDSAAEAALGTDFELIQQDNGQYAWEVDTAHGATDGKTVSGIPNLSQGLGVRLREVQGDMILTPHVGLPRTVGANPFFSGEEEARWAVRQQMIADPRINRLLKLVFEADGDVLSIGADLVPIGYQTARTITRTLT
jgi:hypothetical protein